MCRSRYKLLPDSQQQELPLAKDEKLVSWEEIIFRGETDSMLCALWVNPLLPPLLSAAGDSNTSLTAPSSEQDGPWLSVSTTHLLLVLHMPS